MIDARQTIALLTAIVGYKDDGPAHCALCIFCTFNAI